VVTALKLSKTFFPSPKSLFRPWMIQNKEKFTRLPFIPIKSGHFLVKLAESHEEKQQVFKLRYQVFHQECAENKSKKPTAIDKDRFDSLSDLLTIIDQRSNQVVGTYRLLPSVRTRNFYAQSEFSLGSFIQTPGVKVELSRACIAPNYRKGSVLTLLWKGLCQYLQNYQAEYLFGCSSVFTPSSTKAAALMHLFAKDQLLLSEWDINPLPAYDRSKQLLQALTQAQPDSKQDEDIPPLLRTYLRAGARLGFIPAYDEEFQCYDFFTVLNVKNFNESFQRKFAQPSC
jgi:putative hemolysin